MKSRRRMRQRKGQFVATAPVVLFVVAAICALTADVGLMLVWQARLQNAADASVLACVQVLVGERLAGEDEGDARAEARAEAERICTLNSSDAGLRIEFGQLTENGTSAANRR